MTTTRTGSRVHLVSAHPRPPFIIIFSLNQANPSQPKPTRKKKGVAFSQLSLWTSTQDHIAKLLKHTEAKAKAKAKAKANTGPTQQVLRRCYHDYNKAVSALSSAYNDLNSETFSDLVDWAGAASLAADDCQVVVKTTYPPLSTMNLDLKRLCEICVAVSKLFT
ncbi:hypothetical protein L3X38_020820 [Prunus dulcis]|uniref:Pectinesterase inhibitor domain-containing protein n=1 Tax=Prunus dulcis TaxID=3755 RepID=A0AAD4VUD0_PRUDU|nr:hypothetical protein L3X38_020820 [Prunus dulcis]